MKKKRGRPVKEQGREEQFHMRMTTKEKDMLSEISIETGQSKTDIMREALKMYYNRYLYCDFS